MFFAGLRELTNTKEIKLHFSSSSITLHEIVVILVEKFPALKDLIFHKIPIPNIDEYLGDEKDFQITSVKFAKNRKIIPHADQGVTFSNGDTLAIFLPLLGG